MAFSVQKAMRGRGDLLLEPETYFFEVPPGDEGNRLDLYLSRQVPFLSRNQIQRLIEKGKVLVNSKKSRSSYRVRGGDFIEMEVPPPEEIILKPQHLPLDIVYEDKDLLVINKPQGLVVHPAPGHYEGTLVNALLYHCPDLTGIGGYLRPGIVHRLDKDTSGLLVVSKNELAHKSLTEQLKNRTLKRKYLALVHGEVMEDKGVIDAPLGRDPRNRKKFAVVPDGKPARSYYRVLEKFPGFTLLEVELETGRTHQIRVHLAYAGYPVAGDPLYGSKRNPLGLPGQALHAYQISFSHPRTGELMTFEAPLPSTFKKALAYLRGEINSLDLPQTSR